MSGTTVVVDYGAGNIFSVAKALEKAGARVKISSRPGEILAADSLVLPGVGSFGSCMRTLAAYDLIGALRDFAAGGRPFLGICLGMQILFAESEESPGVAGLGILPGRVRLLPDKTLKIPHVGWNSLTVKKPDALFAGFTGGGYVYFVHSYHVCPGEDGIISAVTHYGGPVTAAVSRGNVRAVQFHPEKSGENGLDILRRFIVICS